MYRDASIASSEPVMELDHIKKKLGVVNRDLTCNSIRLCGTAKVSLTRGKNSRHGHVTVILQNRVLSKLVDDAHFKPFACENNIVLA